MKDFHISEHYHQLEATKFIKTKYKADLTLHVPTNSILRPIVFTETARQHGR